MMLKTTPTKVLIELLCQANEDADQETINDLAYELALRIYVPGKGVTLEKLMYDFGYRQPEQKIDKKTFII